MPEGVAGGHHVGALHPGRDDDDLSHGQAVGILQLVEGDEVLDPHPVPFRDAGEGFAPLHHMGAGFTFPDHQLLSYDDAAGIAQFVELDQILDADTVAAADLPQGLAPLHHVQDAALGLGGAGQGPKGRQRSNWPPAKGATAVGPSFVPLFDKPWYPPHASAHPTAGMGNS